MKFALAQVNQTVGDLSVLADVPKTLVHRIALRLAEGSLPALKPLLALLTTAGLKMDQPYDDGPIPYAVLDPILEHHIEHGLDGDIIISLGFDETAVKRILALVKANEQRLRQLPLGLKVTSRAFGKKRRMPVAHNYKSWRLALKKSSGVPNNITGGQFRGYDS